MITAERLESLLDEREKVQRQLEQIEAELCSIDQEIAELEAK